MFNIRYNFMNVFRASKDVAKRAKKYYIVFRILEMH